uniref:Uncharacterized protein TCIL3000_8_6120 n=1 Tax=Trypanosoma congolense (strain IL3000) TaxID=1068625 RepID=G0USM2_TRYCI|nr:unnamed protein product [Trypanosoma congolense IL3000]
MYINKLQTLRGEYQHVMSSRMGPFPSYKEWQLEQKMRPLYNRIVAGITQGSMEDLPSMKYVEVRLRELRLLILDKLYEGRERTLQLPLLQLRYFAYNRSVETNAWAVGYIRDARAHIHSQQIHHQHAPYTSVSGSEEEGDDQLGGGSLGDRLQEEKYESELAKRAEGESSRHNRLYLKALDDLRETISDPYTVARYSVTRPLAELLPVEFKYFLCDLVLRRAALLYTPRIFLLDEKTDETRQGQGIWGVGGEPDDPHDIVGIFQCVLGRKEFSEVLCAFEEWYRLHQVEKYDVTHVSRQELLALTTNM